MQRILVAETPSKAGERIKVSGWIATRRDHGKLIFIDLRDASGTLQVVFKPDNAELHIAADKLRPEWVVAIEGTIGTRPKGMENPNLATGSVELVAEKLEVLNESGAPPFPLDTDGLDIDEELRLKYRYLDLRRARLQKNIRNRAKVIAFIRKFLDAHNFIEIETPILTKSTPEGARDFLVPSRLQHGKFYALPQSPQQYKQLLMVAGFERYFQIARCFRDEDPRKDRAYGEFTQLDLEISFVTQEDVLNLAETLFTKLVTELFPQKRITRVPWPRLSHKEAMGQYGTDKPDLRENKDDPNELAFSWTIDFPLFKEQSAEDFFHGSGKAKFAPSHHMFTAPHPDDVALLGSEPMKVRGLQHDLVLNGFEVGGGSIRIHQPEVQATVFDLIGFTEAQKRMFSHMLTAFTYGVPPHGGIAPGIDRLLMVLQNEPNIREVMAFPKTGDGSDPMMSSPAPVEEKQLKELGISLRKE